MSKEDVAMTPDALNAALAARLAPLFGETAVYALQSGWWCEQHGFWRDSIVVRGITDGCLQCLQPMTPATERQPRDFTDPAVLWPLWERWVVGHDGTLCICRVRTGAFEATVWQSAFSGWARSASVTEAVARAWLAALEATPDG